MTWWWPLKTPPFVVSLCRDTRPKHPYNLKIGWDYWRILVKSPSHLGWFRAIIFSHTCQHLYLYCHPYILLIWWKIIAFLPTSWSGGRPEQVTGLPFFLAHSGRSLWQVVLQTNLKLDQTCYTNFYLCIAQCVIIASITVIQNFPDPGPDLSLSRIG